MISSLDAEASSQSIGGFRSSCSSAMEAGQIADAAIGLIDFYPLHECCAAHISLCGSACMVEKEAPSLKVASGLSKC